MDAPPAQPQPQKKRRRPAAAPPPPPPIQQPEQPLPRTTTAKFKVEITDDYNVRKTLFTDNWRSSVLQLGYSLDHPMPAYFDRDASYVLHPLLAADPKTVSATPCSVRVTFLQ